MRKYIVPGIGALAFVIGGLVARRTAFDYVDKLERTFDKKIDPSPEQD